MSVKVALTHGHRGWNVSCLLQCRIVTSLMSSLLKAADRDIPKRAEVQSTYPRVTFKNAPSLSSLRQERPCLPLTRVCLESTRTWTWQTHVGLKNRLSPFKTRCIRGLLSRLFRPEQRATDTEQRRRYLKLTEGSVQTVTTTRKGGQRSKVMKTTIYPNIARGLVNC